MEPSWPPQHVGLLFQEGEKFYKFQFVCFSERGDLRIFACLKGPSGYQMEKEKSGMGWMS